MSKSWYLRTPDGNRSGPFSSSQIRQMVSAGEVARDTELSPDGKQWRIAGRIKGVFSEPPQLKPVSDVDDVEVEVNMTGVVDRPQSYSWMRELQNQPFGVSIAIESTHPSTLNSESLNYVRVAITECASRKHALYAEAQSYEASKSAAKWSKFWLCLIPFSKRLFKEKHAEIAARTKYCTEQREEALRRYKNTRVDIKLNLTSQQSTAFNAFMQTFHTLASCHFKWDITAAARIDQFRERTLASTAVDRKNVSLRVSDFGHIVCDYKALEFTNSNGAHLFFYPMFCVVGFNQYDFSVLDLREIAVAYDLTRFHEEETVPADTRVFGTTWKRANKDGSPDRRFSVNYEIPIVEYCELHFQSKSGLNELYMFSNASAARNFANAFRDYQDALFH